MAEEDIIKERIRKLNELKELGINPYPYSYKKTHDASEILEKYNTLKPEEESKDTVNVAGRLMQMRKMGKASFMHIQDQSGKIQLYFRQDDIGKEKYKLIKKLDIGDFIGVFGNIFATKTGEISIYVKDFEILCKSLKPLPEKFHGIKDEDIRFRKRELDLIMNPDTRKLFEKRTKIINAVREFMNKKGFLDVQTPTLQTIYGGAEARPFITHINAWDMNLYLQISPELFLKRLIVGGFEKVYTICKNFRNEGVDKTHNPEFTMMEFYQSYVDYEEMMKMTEELFEYVALKVLGNTKIKYDDKEIDLKAPWQRITVKEALKKFAKLDVDKLSDDELQDLVNENKIELEDYTRGWMIIGLFEELVEPNLIQPIFVTDYPKEASPLCKEKRGNPELIEKVEPYINGWEIGNGYSELNNPAMQRELLEKQAEDLRGGAEEAHPMDEDFVNAIETGMPPTGGMGIGIDRMIILMTDANSLREVLLFPTMKPEQNDDIKEEKKSISK